MRVHQAAAITLTAGLCALTVAACGSQGGLGSAQGATSAASTPATPTPSMTVSATAAPSVSATSAPAATPTPASTATAGTTSSSGGSTCVTSQLGIALVNTGALAGQAGGYLKFTNDSQVTCRITGYPVVTGLTAAGQATTLRHAQSTMFGAWTYASPPPVVTLHPGDSAYAVVAAVDLPVGSQTSCPAPETRLRVAAPGSGGTVLVSAYLPGAGTYLPACAMASGSPSGEVSTITTLSRLAH
jgi:hypothetical protein